VAPARHNRQFLGTCYLFSTIGLIGLLGLASFLHKSYLPIVTLIRKKKVSSLSKHRKCYEKIKEFADRYRCLPSCLFMSLA
jgi:hypothetical protein